MLPTSRLLQAVVRDRAKTIGFIGLGAMGREMAANIASKTFSENNDPATTIIVHDVFEQNLNRFLSDGAALNPGRTIMPASSPASVARQASTIITMLPSSPHVREVYLGEDGVLSGLQQLGDPSDASSSTLCIDGTTLDPAVAVEVANAIKKAGGSAADQAPAFDMIDAPVSGGVVGARAGTLSFMVGSDSSLTFTQAEPILLKMGSRAIHCGKNGNGLVAKIANNLLLGISMLGVSEAMLLGTSHGLSPALLAHIFNTSTGKCWASEVNNPVPGALKGTANSPPADREYEGGFASRLMSKDLGLAMETAKLTSVPTPLGTLTHQIYEHIATDDQFKDRDFAIAYQALIAARHGNKK